MNVFATAGNDNIARVYLADFGSDRHVEFVESKIPNTSRDEKWVIILSSMIGCPIKCPMCDAGSVKYNGKLSKDEMIEQIDYLVNKYYPSLSIPSKKFKIQFARVGEPSLNKNVLNVLEELPKKYDAPGLIPCISTVAPRGSEGFLNDLLAIKERYYNGKFQMQFSIHTTDIDLRNKIIPCNSLCFEEIANIGSRFVLKNDRKITLNFIAMKDTPIDSEIISKYFDPNKFLVKITPLNPTSKSEANNLANDIDIHNPSTFEPAKALLKIGYDVIISVGELEENSIGSNCGQFIRAHSHDNIKTDLAYNYPLSYLNS